MKIATCLMILMLTGGSACALVETPQEEEAGREKWRKVLDEVPAMPIEERIPLLQSAVLKLSQPSIYPNRELAEPLFQHARELLIATPGYGDYYRDQLTTMAEGATRNGPAWSNFQTESGYVMQTLRLLPTVESVRALSEMLDHDKTRNIPHEGGSLAEMASAALFNMIENPPGRTHPPPWREWRERVKSGKETFQFKGSEVRYNFQGPIEASTSRPDNQGLPPTGSTSTGERPPASDQTGQAVGESKDIAKKLGIVIAVLLVTAAGFWKWRSKAGS